MAGGGNPEAKHPSFIHLMMELTKIRLVALVLMSTAVGYYLAVEGPLPLGHFFHVLLATGFVAAGSLALNQWMEWRLDALMKRTMRRPIPAGHLQPLSGLLIGLALSGAGLVYLYLTAHWLTVSLAAATLLSYVLVYTPLKRRTTLNTMVGALPGAIPPMIGWSAAAGSLGYEAWILFSILFLWQVPHFLAIAWLYREDYRRAGFAMLSVGDAVGNRVALQAVISSAMLLPVSLLPTVFGMTGMIYFFTAIVLGIGFLFMSAAGLKNIDQKARPLFAMSIIYLSLLLLVMVIDKA